MLSGNGRITCVLALIPSAIAYACRLCATARFGLVLILRFGTTLNQMGHLRPWGRLGRSEEVRCNINHIVDRLPERIIGEGRPSGLMLLKLMPLLIC